MRAIGHALRQRGLQLLLTAGLISLTGDWIMRVGLAYYIYALTGSTLASATMLLASFVPQIVLSSVAGVFADRWNTKPTMIISNLLLAAGLLPLLALHRADQVWIIYLVTAWEGCVQQFFVPAQQSALPALTDDAYLVTANALNGQASDVSRLAGSAAGGVLAATGGLVALTFADCASFVLAAALIARIPAARRPGGRTADRQSPRARLIQLRAEWADGLVVAVRNRVLRVILIFLAVSSVGEGIMATLFAPFVRAELHGSSQAYGFIVSAQAVGGIAGGLIAASAGHRIRAYRLLGWGAVAFGTVDLMLFLYPLIWVAVPPAIVLMAVVGVPGALMLTGTLTLVQRHTSDTHRGRLFGALGAVEGIAIVSGTIAAGFLGQAIGIIPVLAAQGAGYLLAGLTALIALRHEKDSKAGAPPIRAPAIASRPAPIVNAEFGSGPAA